MSHPADKNILFFFMPTEDGKPPILMLGVPEAAYEDMKATDCTKTLDLTSLGIPIRLSLFYTKDHDSGVARIDADAKAAGIAMLDMRNHDLSLKVAKPEGDQR